ncbi:MAG: SEC-C domain-containing protein [Muribaculaceae bacterium]|nr:SEC-C domain-containing protein [Muribaculaceae bacterium]
MLNNLNGKSMSALMRGQIFVRKAPATSEATLDSEREHPSQSLNDMPPAKAPEKPTAPAPELRQAAPRRDNDYSQYTASKENLPGEAANRAASQGASPRQQRPQPMKAQPKVGRNDPCPCGSGKKFKNCHGRQG